MMPYVIPRKFAAVGACLITFAGTFFFPSVLCGEEGNVFCGKGASLGIEYFPEKYLSVRPVEIGDFSASDVKDIKAFEALFDELEKNPFSETLPHEVLSAGMRSSLFDDASAKRFLDLAQANQDALDLNLCAACLTCTSGGSLEMASFNVANIICALKKIPNDNYTMHHVRLYKAALRLVAVFYVMENNGLEGLKVFEESETLCCNDVSADKYSYLIDAFLRLRANASAQEGCIRPNVFLPTQRAFSDAVCRIVTDKCLSDIENDKLGLGAHHLDCISLLQAGRGEDLKRIVLVKLAADPENKDLLRFAASVYDILGEYANAARLMRQVVLSYGAGECPIKDCLFFAELSRKAKFFDMAESACRVAEFLDGAEENAVSIDENLSMILYEKGDYHGAVIALKNVPDCRLKYFLCAYSLYRMKEYTAAIGAAIKGFEMLEEGQTEVPYNILCLCASASDKINDMSFINKVAIPQCTILPDNAEFLNTIGYICADRNYELDKAEQFIFEALGYQPYNEAFLDSAAWVKYRKGDYASAVKYMEKCLKEYASEGERKIDGVILDHAGDIYFASGEKNRAVDFWRRALKADGDTDNEKILLKIDKVAENH